MLMLSYKSCYIILYPILLKDTFEQMYSANPEDLRRPLRVEFRGEEAVDEGGVMREFFRLISQELFAPSAGLFLEVEESRRLWFAPTIGPERKLEDYWMVGVIVGLAVLGGSQRGSYERGILHFRVLPLIDFNSLVGVIVGLAVFRGNRLSSAACLTQVFFKSVECFANYGDP